MTILLNNIIPIPLKDKPNLFDKNIWAKQTQFSSNNLSKIVAASGTGKTTLMHILYGLRKDYTGNVFYDNLEINMLNVNELANYRQNKISIIFQDLKLFNHLTAFENIELNRTLGNEIYGKEKIFEMAEELGVQNILQNKIDTCSYGEQQRVAIIRALIQPFELLLMDEPFSHLDINNTTKAARLIFNECKCRKAGFVLTDLDEDNYFNYTQTLYL